MSTWCIEGEWSGYTSSQRHVVHREYATRDTFADEVRKLGYIRYTDGTSLILHVRKLEKGTKREKEISGYTSLIRECLAAGVHLVDDLPGVRKNRSGGAA